MSYLVMLFTFEFGGQLDRIFFSDFAVCDWFYGQFLSELSKDCLVECLQGSIALLFCLDEGSLLWFEPVSLFIRHPWLACHIQQIGKGFQASSEAVPETWQTRHFLVMVCLFFSLIIWTLFHLSANKSTSSLHPPKQWQVGKRASIVLLSLFLHFWCDCRSANKCLQTSRPCNLAASYQLGYKTKTSPSQHFWLFSSPHRWVQHHYSPIWWGLCQWS